VYNIPEIDEYLTKGLESQIPRALMWPLYEPQHSPMHVSADIYGVTGRWIDGRTQWKNYDHASIGAEQFLHRQRRGEFYIGIPDFDTTALGYFNRELRLTGNDVLSLSDHPEGAKEIDIQQIASSGYRFYSGVPPSSDLGYQIVLFRESDDGSIGVSTPRKVILPSHYDPSMASIFGETANEKVIGAGIVPRSRTEEILRNGHLPRPNVIIARDLAMGPWYSITREYQEKLGEGLIEGDLIHNYNQRDYANRWLDQHLGLYKEWAGNSPLCLVLDLHDFMEHEPVVENGFQVNDGDAFFPVYRDINDFPLDLIGAHFRDVQVVRRDSLEKLSFGAYRRRHVAGPIVLARNNA